MKYTPLPFFYSRPKIHIYMLILENMTLFLQETVKPQQKKEENQKCNLTPNFKLIIFHCLLTWQWFRR